jgi:predicted O-methyltransferase YrrM
VKKANARKNKPAKKDKGESKKNEPIERAAKAKKIRTNKGKSKKEKSAKKNKMKKFLSARIFDYDKSLLPNKYLAKLEMGVTDIEEAKEKTGYSIGYPGWNLLYFSMLCSLRRDSFNIVLETGTNLGCSTIALAQALLDSQLDGCIHTVEIDNDNYEQAVSNVVQAGVAEVVELHNTDSLTFLQEENAFSGKIISYAFLDGCHEQDYVIKEFNLLYPFLDHKSIVVFDNTYRLTEDPVDKRVNGALQRIKEKYGGNLINFENVSWSTPGLAIWQKDPFYNDWHA